MFDDLGQAYKKAVRAFADAGCRYLQLDEVFIAMLCDPKYRQQMKDRGDDPDALGPLYGDLINVAISDIPSDMTVTMHLCRGNYKSTFMGSGGYDAMQEVLFDRIKVNGYFMEYDTERAGGFEPLKRLQKGRLAVLGLVTTKTGTLEGKDAIKRRIEEAAKYHRSRPAVPVAAMRLRLDRGRQRLGRGRRMGQAADDRGGRPRGLGKLSECPISSRARSPSSPARDVASAAASRCSWRRRARSVVVCDIGASLDGAGTDAGPAQAVVDEIKKAGGKADRLDAVDQRARQCRQDRAVRARRLRPRRHPGQQCRHPARPHFSPHELVGLVRRHQCASARQLSDEPCLRRAFPRAEFRQLRAYDVDLGPGRQFRPGQLHGGEARHCRPVARHRARHGAFQCALELRGAVRLDADDRFDSGRDRRGKSAYRGLSTNDAGEDRAARRLSRFRQGGRHQRADFFGAQQRDLSVQPDPPDPHAAALRRLDSRKSSTSSSKAPLRPRSRRSTVQATCSRGIL